MRQNLLKIYFASISHLPVRSDNDVLSFANCRLDQLKKKKKKKKKYKALFE